MAFLFIIATVLGLKKTFKKKLFLVTLVNLFLGLVASQRDSSKTLLFVTPDNQSGRCENVSPNHCSTLSKYVANKQQLFLQYQQY